MFQPFETIMYILFIFVVGKHVLSFTLNKPFFLRMGRIQDLPNEIVHVARVGVCNLRHRL